MPKFAPKVLDGTRGARDTRIDEMRAQSEAVFDATPAEMPKVDGTVYLSAFPGYMVQLSAPADVTDPFTGKKTVGRPVVARFAEGRYINNARDPKLRKFIDEEMQSKTRFGKPGAGSDYWLAEDAIRMSKAAAKASATATLRALAKQNPDELEKLISELRQGDATDVQMPAPPAAPGA
jgi:hypothetical protein